MSSHNSIQQLAELLQNHAKPVIRPQRLALSPIYDLDYRMAVIALAFAIHSTKTSEGEHRIDTSRLKLLQFVAQRPSLLPAMNQWASSKKTSTLLRGSSQRLRRGYMGDSTYDQVVEYMIACGILRPEGQYLALGRNGSYVDSIRLASEKESMFTQERFTLAELLRMRVTVAMLEGR
jgi:hypothetical protein